jgi:CheY-like chemotaxis protein
MLSGAGYVSITSTMDPGEVCQLHRKNLYDLILLDLVLPAAILPTRSACLERDSS